MSYNISSNKIHKVYLVDSGENGGIAGKMFMLSTLLDTRLTYKASTTTIPFRTVAGVIFQQFKQIIGNIRMHIQRKANLHTHWVNYNRTSTIKVGGLQVITILAILTTKATRADKFRV